MTPEAITGREVAAQALAAARLYGIIDLGYVAPAEIVRATSEMIAGGVGILQLRAKGVPAAEIERLARLLLPIAARAGVPFIINDHPEIAAALGCAGVHLGQDDLSIARAREILRPGTLIGRSTHSVDQAVTAEAEGADYIGFGPLWATATKPGRPAIGLTGVAEVHRRVSIPIFCIGGITEANLDDVITAGARRVVIVSELLRAADRARYVRTVLTRLGGSAKTQG